MKLLDVSTREKWRAWLAANHRKESEIWLINRKKHTGQARVPYEHAVEEALCFGWIDSLARRLDDDRFAQKFTPRRAGSNWSQPNRLRFDRLVRAGRVTEAGFARGPLPVKKPETRRRRLAEAIDRLTKNQTLGMK